MKPRPPSRTMTSAQIGSKSSSLARILDPKLHILNQKSQPKHNFTNLYNSLHFHPRSHRNASPKSPMPSTLRFSPTNQSPGILRFSISRGDSQPGSPKPGSSHTRNRSLLSFGPMTPSSNVRPPFFSPVKPGSAASSRVVFRQIGTPISDSQNLNFHPESPSKSARVKFKRRKTISLINSVRVKYTDIVNSPTNGVSDLPDAEIKTGGHSDFVVISKPDSAFFSPEDAKFADDVEGTGKRGFLEAINMYNRFHSGGLFDSDGETFVNNIKLGSIIPERFQPRMSSRTPSSKTVRTSERNSTNKNKNPLEPKSADLKKFSSLFAQELINFDQFSSKRYIERQSYVQAPVVSDSFNIKEMKKLSDNMKKQEPLSRYEKNFINSIKEGAEIKDLQYLLNGHKELINIRDNRNETPLHWAVKKGLTDVVQFLCVNGADVNAVDMAGRTSLDIAKRIQNWPIISIKILNSQVREKEVKVKAIA